MSDPVKLTINGVEVETTPDKMLIQAANEAGVYIPYLCYHPGMKPYGACRMCVVEVEGQRGTPAACTLPVRDGMVVNTVAAPAEGVRSTTLDLLLSEHPHGCLTCHRIDLCGPQDVCLRHVDVLDRCVTCPKNERCELKDTTRFHPQPQVSPLTFQYRGLQVETKDPFYDRDYNLCIVCARCVRACDELRGDVALGMTERAGQVLVGTVLGESLLEAGCEFCGACLDVCPVGALTETDNKWERATRTVQSVCGECPVGCTMTYEVNRQGRVVRAIPELNSPVNKGQACFRGKFGYTYVNDKRRLRTPLVRRDGVLTEATWEEAIAAAAEGLAPHKGAFALLTGGRETNEELYAAQKFARAVMGSNSVDMASNDRPGVAEGIQDVFSVFAGTLSVQELRSSKVVLAVSANPTEDQNVVAVPIKQAVRAGTQKLIVVDAREVELTRYAALWLRPYPGTEGAVVGGMLKAVLDLGLADPAEVAGRADGFDDLAASLEAFTPEAVEDVTGVPAEQLRAAAELYATGGPAATLYAADSTAHGTRRNLGRAATALAVVTGNVGVPGAGLMPLMAGANVQGAWDMGVWSMSLPGHSFVRDGAARERLGALWGVSLPTAEGRGNVNIVRGASDGTVRAMLVLGTHAAMADGSLGDVAGAFANLQFLAVSDAFPSAITEQADVVFPATVWAEKTGTYTNLERRVQALVPVVCPHNSQARSDVALIGDLATAMGARGFSWAGPETVLEEIAQAVPQYAGITYAGLLDDTVRSAKPDTSNPQPTQVLYSEDVRQGTRWPYPDTRPVLAPLTLYARPERTSDEFPLMLAHGRVLVQPGRDAGVASDGKRNRVARAEEFVLHPADAERAGLTDGEHVWAVADSGWRQGGYVRISDETLEGVVSLTSLFGALAVEADASADPDPMNRIPRLDARPVRIEREQGAQA